MDKATSMYLGGDIIEAVECDYSTSRDFGLKCPFCNNAVFLRRGEVVRPYFSHYPGKKPGNQSSQDCEARCLTREGRAKIEAIKVEAKRQRLSLYQRHLWEMIAEDRSVPKNLIHSCSRLVDRRWIDEKSLYVSQLWKARLNFLLTNIDRAFDGVIKTLASASIEFIGDGREKQLTDIIFRRKYLESVDAQYHKLICSEIFSFLASSTGYLVFNKVCKLILLTELVDFAKTGKQASPQTIKNQITEMTDNYWIAAIQSSIIAIRWIDLINKRIK